MSRTPPACWALLAAAQTNTGASILTTWISGPAHSRRPFRRTAVCCRISGACNLSAACGRPLYLLGCALSGSSRSSTRDFENSEAGPERCTRLRANADFLRSGLQALGYNTGFSQTGVIPVIMAMKLIPGSSRAGCVILTSLRHQSCSRQSRRVLRDCDSA